MPSKRKAVLSSDIPTTKTTLAKSPEATKKLTDIKVEEVSIVDFPANGEPFVVMKSLKKEKIEKASRKEIPVEKMIELHKQLLNVQNTLKLVDQELENSKVEKSVDEDPIILKGLFNNVIHVLKAIRGDEDAAPVEYEEVAKQYEKVSKGNAISFLTRDRYAYVTQSVSEYLTTYVDGIEHDDSGPMLMPLGLDSGVENSLEKMEDVVEEENQKTNSEDTNPNTEEDCEEVNKTDKSIGSLEQKIDSLKKQLEDASVSDEDVNKKGSKISKDRLKKLKSIATDIGNANEQMCKFLNDLDSGSSENREETNKMADENKQENGTEEVEKSEESAKQTETVAEKKTDDVITKEDQFDKLSDTLKALCDKLDSRFEKIEEAQKSNTEELKKFASMRSDSRVDADDTKPVEKSAEEIKKENGSFKSIFRLQ